MLKSLKLDEIYVTKPTTINVYGGVKIHIDDNNEITVEGHSKLKFTTDSDIEFDGKNINLQAQENVYIGAGKHIVEQAPRIDLNPNYYESGYKNAKSS